ncbi:membrane protein [Kushneria sinocarnis]|uniref:Membrane protein n=1 Tax=Kushneria sinocarnis TaxID=595502 RepID=A0A420X0F8_9GAMM|nr:YihY/virulence factor BrkB family protein [Kushneria sinocarnis]RKR07237.1 membrane protein [Kushneria sinocarnis]
MAEHDSAENARGRQARRPGQLTRAGWRDACLRVKGCIDRDHIALLAAGVAFYGLLAIFPVIATLISLWGLLSDPQQVQHQITVLSAILPPEASGLIEQQVRSLEARAGNGITVVVGVLLAVLSATRGVDGLIEGMNIVYGESENRPLFRRLLLTLVMTAGLTLLTLVTLLTIIFVPMVARQLPFGWIVATLMVYLRWPLLLVLVMFSIAVLYRYGPNRRKPRWEWVGIGTFGATLLWIVGSIGFSAYVDHFASFDRLYGSLGAVVILLIWFWLSAFMVLLGGAMNSEMERQTRRDTTEDPEQPLGERHAHAADTVGRKP